jgi:hypothetical protein
MGWKREASRIQNRHGYAKHRVNETNLREGNELHEALQLKGGL